MVVIYLSKHRNDIILILVAFITFFVGILLYLSFSDGDGQKAMVYSGEDLILEIDMSVDAEYTVTGVYTDMIIKVSDGRVKVLESGCYNQDCVLLGYRGNSGDIIACLPNNIFIRIVGDK